MQNVGQVEGCVDKYSPLYTRELPPGNFLAHPHNNATWYASNDETRIYHFLGDNNLETFSLPPNSRCTRRLKLKYLRDDSLPADLHRSELKLASILVSPDNASAKLHSATLQPAPNIFFVPTLLDTLRAGLNPTLWDTFTYNGDGWWIADALLDGTLHMGSDGLYMQARHRGACSGAFVLHCSRTRRQAACGWAELQQVSENYCGELLGVIGFFSVLHATLAHPTFKAPLDKSHSAVNVRAYSDCKGVISYGNNTEMKLKQGQAHVDLICVIHKLFCDLPVKVTFIYVLGHRDHHVPYELLTIEQQLN